MQLFIVYKLSFYFFSANAWTSKAVSSTSEMVDMGITNLPFQKIQILHPQGVVLLLLFIVLLFHLDIALQEIIEIFRLLLVLHQSLILQMDTFFQNLLLSHQGFSLLLQFLTHFLSFKVEATFFVMGELRCDELISGSSVIYILF